MIPARFSADSLLIFALTGKQRSFVGMLRASSTRFHRVNSAGGSTTASEYDGEAAIRAFRSAVLEAYRSVP